VSQFVLDASVALAWYVDSPMPVYAKLVKEALEQGGSAIAPALWSLEMANGLHMADRRGNLTAEEVDWGLQQLELLTRSVVEIEIQWFSIREAFVAAKSFRLTAYAAVYLELARRKGMPLATLDHELKAAAGKLGVGIFR
jgi:predicted nucleic acid-binding protein